MRFKIDMGLNSAAFESESGPAAYNATEVARILRDLAEKMDFGDLRHGDKGPIRDVNGNRIGEWRVDLDAEI